MEIDWNDITTTSHLDTIHQVKALIEDEEYEEAIAGLDELYDTMASSEKRALESQLTRLMMHILKWKYQPLKRTTSWARSIANARIEIERLQKFMPSLNKSYIEKIWNGDMNDAIKLAKAEMLFLRNQSFIAEPLTWKEVFEDEYFLEEND